MSWSRTYNIYHWHFVEWKYILYTWNENNSKLGKSTSKQCWRYIQYLSNFILLLSTILCHTNVICLLCRSVCLLSPQPPCFHSGQSCRLETSASLGLQAPWPCTHWSDQSRLQTFSPAEEDGEINGKSPPLPPPQQTKSADAERLHWSSPAFPISPCKTDYYAAKVIKLGDRHICWFIWVLHTSYSQSILFPSLRNFYILNQRETVYVKLRWATAE